MTLRVHAKQAQVAAVTVNFNVDATSQVSGISSDEEFAFLHVGANSFGVDAVAFDEGPFDAKSSIDQADQGVDVAKIRRAKSQGI